MTVETYIVDLAVKEFVNMVRRRGGKGIRGLGADCCAGIRIRRYGGAAFVCTTDLFGIKMQPHCRPIPGGGRMLPLVDNQTS